MKNYVIGTEDIAQMAPFFNTSVGKHLIKPAMYILGLDMVNDTYKRCCHLRGNKFATAVLDDLNVKYELNVPDKDFIPLSGPFITVSNHPFGALDGIAMISMIGSVREDYKMMVNSMLNHIEAMSPSFIAVEPYSDKKGSKTNLQGIKESISHIKNGHPLGFFPAGGVSGIKNDLQIKDNPWAENIIRLIKQMKVDVIPIHVHGNNSLFFSILGIISWKLRTLRLPREVYRSKGRTIKISVGNKISVEEQAQYDDLEEFAKFLYDKTYQCGTDT